MPRLAIRPSCAATEAFGAPLDERCVLSTADSLARSLVCVTQNPHYYILHTPGHDVTSIRVINQNTVEFPFDAWVLPYKVASAPPGPQMLPF